MTALPEVIDVHNYFLGCFSFHFIQRLTVWDEQCDVCI